MCPTERADLEESRGGEKQIKMCCPTRTYRGEKNLFFPCFSTPPPKGRRGWKRSGWEGYKQQPLPQLWPLVSRVRGRRKRTPLLVEKRMVDGTKWQIRAPRHCTVEIFDKECFSEMYLFAISLYAKGKTLHLNPPNNSHSVSEIQLLDTWRDCWDTFGMHSFKRLVNTYISCMAVFPWLYFSK